MVFAAALQSGSELRVVDKAAVAPPSVCEAMGGSQAATSHFGEGGSLLSLLSLLAAVLVPGGQAAR